VSDLLGENTSMDVDVDSAECFDLKTSRPRAATVPQVA
jgi:hypothetical protein